MWNIISSQTLPLFNRLTQVRSSSQTAQPPIRIQTCELRTPRKCIFVAKWRELIKPLYKNLLTRSTITSKTNIVSCCPTNSSSVRTLSRIRHTILNTWSRLYSPPQKNFSGSLTSPERCIPSSKLWTSRMWLFTGQEIPDCKFASGIAWLQLTRRVLYLNSFFERRIKNYAKHRISP